MSSAADFAMRFWIVRPTGAVTVIVVSTAFFGDATGFLAILDLAAAVFFLALLARTAFGLVTFLPVGFRAGTVVSCLYGSLVSYSAPPLARTRHRVRCSRLAGQAIGAYTGSL